MEKVVFKKFVVFTLMLFTGKGRVLFYERRREVTCHVEVRPAGCPHSYSAEGNAGGAVGEFLYLCTQH